MNTKKMVSILLILFALGIAVLFAETTGGVQWNFSESRGVTTLTNNNSYGVTVMVVLWNGRPYGSGWLEAGQTKEISAQVKSITVSRIKAPTPQW